LPADFDFAIWNCVPPDQQIDFLHGDEIVELHNLCRPDTPGAITDPGGNTVLRVALPPHECLLLLEHDNGARVEQALAVDTVLIEPEDGRLILVWRTVLPKEDGIVLDTCAFGMQTFAERDRRQRQQAGAMRRHEREAVQSMRGGAGEMAP
jgi:hypothetical protein